MRTLTECLTELAAEVGARQTRRPGKLTHTERLRVVRVDEVLDAQQSSRPWAASHEVCGGLCWAIRIWLPNGSRAAHSSPYGCSTGSWVSSTPAASSFS